MVITVGVAAHPVKRPHLHPGGGKRHGPVLLLRGQRKTNKFSFMEEVIYIEGIKEAAPVGWNGSYADGGKSQSWWLPVTVVRSHVNLSAIDHPEMASDINGLASCFLALCAKALIKAYRIVDFYFHKDMIVLLLESLERLVKSTSSAFLLKRKSICRNANALKLSALESTIL